MQRRWMIAWPTAALFATASCITLARAQNPAPPPPATAQPQAQAGPGAAPPPPPPSTDQDDEDDDDDDRSGAAMGGNGGPTENQVADIVDARVAVLKAELRLTPEQARDWPPLQTALHDFGMERARAMLQQGGPRRERHARPVRSNGPAGVDKPDDIARMRAEADALDQRAAALKKLADAAQPIYANLDERQRKRLVQYIDQGFGGRRH